MRPFAGGWILLVVCKWIHPAELCISSPQRESTACTHRSRLPLMEMAASHRLRRLHQETPLQKDQTGRRGQVACRMDRKGMHRM